MPSAKTGTSMLSLNLHLPGWRSHARPDQRTLAFPIPPGMAIADFDFTAAFAAFRFDFPPFASRPALLIRHCRLAAQHGHPVMHTKSPDPKRPAGIIITDHTVILQVSPHHTPMHNANITMDHPLWLRGFITPFISML